ncbi:DUF3500 domain-containing protein [Seonamhaeicola maritimus]|uniref:DUF3500 domain-containing protein n=1 Tax=Seonamhaeicola maritimus TaxID=2591822 RepID=UPI0024943BF3|nr:DUF3500 domain-containing protein [Seonamhaeicola maritimus]
MRKLITLSVSCMAIFLLLSFSFHKSKHVVKFLDCLNTEQLKKVSLPFDDTSRTSWHFLPSTMYPREGITLKELNKDQEAVFFKMLTHFLSESGYNKTTKIIDLENVLVELGGDPKFRDAKAYYIAIYGNPREDKIWAWSFEGHHVSLNFTVKDHKISASPRFFGSNPAIVKEGSRKGERTLHREEKLAYLLMMSLSDEQKKEVIFRDTAYPDIVTSNSTTVTPLEPVGIKATKLNDEQKVKLKAILYQYLRDLPDKLAQARESKIHNEEFNDILFAWAGSAKKGEPHYYRIQGKTFLIELDNTQNNANHIHCVWRDFDGDFGRDIIREHYKNSKHHSNN